MKTPKVSALLVVTMIAILFIQACGPPTEPYWEAIYCSQEGCPEGSSEVTRSNLLRYEETCPPTKRVQISTVKVGDISIPIYSTYYLKSDTCREFHPTAVPFE